MTPCVGSPSVGVARSIICSETMRAVNQAAYAAPALAMRQPRTRITIRYRDSLTHPSHGCAPPWREPRHALCRQIGQTDARVWPKNKDMLQLDAWSEFAVKVTASSPAAFPASDTPPPEPRSIDRLVRQSCRQRRMRRPFHATKQFFRRKAGTENRRASPIRLRDRRSRRAQPVAHTRGWERIHFESHRPPLLGDRAKSVAFPFCATRRSSFSSTLVIKTTSWIVVDIPTSRFASPVRTPFRMRNRLSFSANFFSTARYGSSCRRANALSCLA